uniref:MHC class IIB antigen n=1 Tax=Callorhinchus milii TaxID=7868 RepID=V9L9J1_CALMI
MSLSAALVPGLRLLLLVSAISVFTPEQNILAEAESYIFRSGCEFNNGTSWTYVEEQIYNKQVIAYYDFNQRKYIANKQWTKPSVDTWNQQAEETYQEGIRVCENNAQIFDRIVLTRLEKPTVTIRPKQSAHTGHLLTCYVTDFYPKEIEVTWRRNGHVVNGDQVSTSLMANGDWTYQIHKVLQYSPESGDHYSCHVHHKSLDSDIDHPWVPEGMPESERIRIIVGALGFAFGFVVLLAGVILRLRNAKAILDASGTGPRLMGAATAN